MNINSVNQLFNEKLQDINSRLPNQTSVNNKFQEMLEKCQLKTSTSLQNEVATTETNNTSNELDVNSLLKTMLSTQTSLSSISQTSDASSSLFPTSTFNSTINMLQQSQLLNALKNNSGSNKDL